VKPSGVSYTPTEKILAALLAIAPKERSLFCVVSSFGYRHKARQKGTAFLFVFSNLSRLKRFSYE
jgi:hypothetical protein